MSSTGSFWGSRPKVWVFWTRCTYVLDEVELYMLDLVQPLRPTCILVAHSVDLVHGIKSHLDQTLFTPRPNRRWTRSNCHRRYRAGTFGTVFVHGEYPTGTGHSHLRAKTCTPSTAGGSTFIVLDLVRYIKMSSTGSLGTKCTPSFL